MTTTIPTNKKLEAAVLGAAMHEAFGLRTVQKLLHSNAEIFQHPPHQFIYQAIEQLAEQGECVDTLTVTEQLRKIGRLQAAGGIGGVAQLVFDVSSAAHVESHCRYLQERYLRRRLLAVCQQGITRATDERSDVF